MKFGAATRTMTLGEFRAATAGEPDSIPLVCGGRDSGWVVGVRVTTDPNEVGFTNECGTAHGNRAVVIERDPS